MAGIGVQAVPSFDTISPSEISSYNLRALTLAIGTSIHRDNIEAISSDTPCARPGSRHPAETPLVFFETKRCHNGGRVEEGEGLGEGEGRATGNRFKTV